MSVILNFFFIPLICITYKLYERMVLARISPGYKDTIITGAVFVDLTTAYDIANHRILLLKVAKIAYNAPAARIMQSLISNRMFRVEMDDKKSRWRFLPQRSWPVGPKSRPSLTSMPTDNQRRKQPLSGYPSKEL